MTCDLSVGDCGGGNAAAVLLCADVGDDGDYVCDGGGHSARGER